LAVSPPLRAIRMRFQIRRRESGVAAFQTNKQSYKIMMMMIAFITIKSSLVPLIEGLCAQI